MFKLLTLSLASAFVAGPAAIAGPYVNVENNSNWTGDDYTGAVTDLHVGYSNDIGDRGSWYIQGGPALVSLDGEELETEASAKVGATFAVADNTDFYGEVSAITSDGDFDDLNVGAKMGVTYSF